MAAHPASAFLGCEHAARPGLRLTLQPVRTAESTRAHYVAELLCGPRTAPGSDRAADLEGAPTTRALPSALLLGSKPWPVGTGPQLASQASPSLPCSVTSQLSHPTNIWAMTTGFRQLFQFSRTMPSPVQTLLPNTCITIKCNCVHLDILGHVPRAQGSCRWRPKSHGEWLCLVSKPGTQQTPLSPQPHEVMELMPLPHCLDVSPDFSGFSSWRGHHPLGTDDHESVMDRETATSLGWARPPRPSRTRVPSETHRPLCRERQVLRGWATAAPDTCRGPATSPHGEYTPHRRLSRLAGLPRANTVDQPPPQQLLEAGDPISPL